MILWWVEEWSSWEYGSWWSSHNSITHNSEKLKIASVEESSKDSNIILLWDPFMMKSFRWKVSSILFIVEVSNENEVEQHSDAFITQ